MNRNSSLRMFIAFTISLTFGCGGGGSNDSEPGNSTGALASCGRRSGPLKIMPLGDSITEAERGHNSYRRKLWQNLTSAGCNVDFVGNRTGVSNGERNGHEVPAQNPDFDQDHEGHWAYRADEIAALVSSSIEAHRPDVVLIHIGTNDMFRGESVSSTIADIGRIIDRIRSLQPTATIFIAKVIPSARENNRLQELNASIDLLATERQSALSPLIVVDHFSGYPVSDNYDGVHPNSTGEARMADRWSNAILSRVVE